MPFLKLLLAVVLMVVAAAGCHHVQAFFSSLTRPPQGGGPVLDHPQGGPVPGWAGTGGLQKKPDHVGMWSIHGLHGAQITSGQALAPLFAVCAPSWSLHCGDGHLWTGLMLCFCASRLDHVCTLWPQRQLLSINALAVKFFLQRSLRLYCKLT